MAYGYKTEHPPRALEAHRTVTSVDTTPPANTHDDWDASLGYPVVRIYADVSFVGGTTPSVDLAMYVRRWDREDPPAAHVARAPAPDSRWETGLLRITGDDTIAFDTEPGGDDFLVVVAAVNGAPTSFQVVLRHSLR